ncbi:hypothetical protein BDF21DRAFT_418079 [Thamnidium elegans]|uniref:Uncharacterized protein n=1 Tax=Thamnidium elegans TaxID=101142 RepID=A0A8H7SI64_9FUNG|nr:hypothetical protein INT48_001724 [Thamnidium elegans]KAI8080932.1 hypothetical protein BDF21DRAFT_418079 [Thamnidium elegans]
MKFTSILFVAAFVLAVSAAPCKDKSHKHYKNKNKGGNKHISYNEEYKINNNYHNVDNSSNDVKEINQTNSADDISADKGLGVNIGLGTKTETTKNNSQVANIS